VPDLPEPEELMNAAVKQTRHQILQDEILAVLNARGPMGYLGLEDRCNLWRTPTELRTALGELVVARRVSVAAVPVKDSEPYLVYGADRAAVPRGPQRCAP
jgi:hypothetical protein